MTKTNIKADAYFQIQSSGNFNLNSIDPTDHILKAQKFIFEFKRKIVADND